MARRRRRSRREEDYDKELEWLVAETAKLKLDLRGLVLSIPRAIIALTHRQDARPWPDGTPKKRPPVM